jgi:hypothetical protein
MTKSNELDPEDNFISPDRRRFSSHEVERIAKAVAGATVQELLNNSEFMHSSCKFNGTDPAIHRQQHDDIKEIIELFKRVNAIKWGVPKTIVTVVVGAMCLWLLKYYKVFQ